MGGAGGGVRVSSAPSDLCRGEGRGLFLYMCIIIIVYGCECMRLSL